MVKDLKEIKEFLNNKNICLLGNAKGILETKKDIEKYDIICRMNRGYPRGKEPYIGKRTDILFLSTRLDETKMLQGFNPKFIVWMVDSDKRANPYIKKNAIQNPVSDRDELIIKLSQDKKKPSTGIMAIYFLLKYIDFKSLNIYGFDGYRSGTWYHNLKTQNWHNFKNEEKLIEKWIKTKENIKLL